MGEGSVETGVGITGASTGSLGFNNVSTFDLSLSPSMIPPTIPARPANKFLLDICGNVRLDEISLLVSIENEDFTF